MKTFFLLNEQLHKRLSVIRSENILVAWNYPEEERVWLDRAFVERNYQNVFNTKEVAELLNKRNGYVNSLLQSKIIDRPSHRAYSIDSKMPGQLYWSEEEVLELRERLFDLAPKNKYGEPKKNLNLISKQELLSKLHDDSSFFVKNESGELIRVWKSF